MTRLILRCTLLHIIQTAKLPSSWFTARWFLASTGIWSFSIPSARIISWSQIFRDTEIPSDWPIFSRSLGTAHHWPDPHSRNQWLGSHHRPQFRRADCHPPRLHRPRRGQLRLHLRLWDLLRNRTAATPYAFYAAWTVTRVGNLYSPSLIRWAMNGTDYVLCWTASVSLEIDWYNFQARKAKN